MRGSIEQYKGQVLINYRTEADLQRGYVDLASAYGWITESEVVVPGWGRLDMVLHTHSTHDFDYVFEFKLSLTKLSVIRRAFQQADGYSRWLGSRGIGRRVHLSAPEIDYDMCNDIAHAYLESVSLTSADMAIHMITGPHRHDERIGRVREKYQELTQERRLVMSAHNALTSFARTDKKHPEMHLKGRSVYF